MAGEKSPLQETTPSRVTPTDATMPSSVDGGHQHLGDEGLGDPKVIGQYEIIKEVGRGSQGVVYRAVQIRTKRQVALKCLLGGSLASESMRLRFEREVETVSAVQHPNIVTVYAVDLVDGQPVLAMEWIDGVPVDEWAMEGGQPRSVDAAIRLMIKICDAVHFAHQRGIIHRDLKPTNILVDASGEPHLLDFGLAKLTGATDTRTLTLTDDFVGTPAYAAPEQFSGNVHSFDVRTDLYALGVMFFEMLTTAFPYELGESLPQCIEAIRQSEPVRPSSLNARINAEIDTITLKTLAKDNRERYQSVEAFAEDLRRYLAGQPILAHPPTALYQLRKLVRRHRGSFAFGLTILALLVAFGVVSFVQAVKLREQRDQAETARKTADDRTIEARRERAIADQKTGEAAASAAEARRQLRESERQNYLANIAAADAALRSGDLVTGRSRLDRAPRDFINWEWSHLARQIDTGQSDEASKAVPVSAPDGRAIGAMAISPDAMRVACGTESSLFIFQAGTAKWLTLSDASAAPARSLAFGSDGELFATTDRERAIQWWDAADLSPRESLRVSEGVRCIASTPNSRLLVIGRQDGALESWDTPGRRKIGEARTSIASVESLAVDSAGRFAAAGAADGSVALVELAGMIAKPVFRAVPGGISALAFSPDGTRVACGSTDRRISIWTVEPTEKVIDIDAHQFGIVALVFMPDGSRLVSGSSEGTLKIWDTQSWEEVLTLRSRTGRLRAVCCTPDGARVISAGDSGLEIWDGRITADELVRQMLSDLASPQEIIVNLEADDALDRPLREVALRIARRMLGDAGSAR